ncbi:MAG TPA: Crp/Fnr family transcriptional regulator [Aestuariivirga sp.]|nr:Crp/Fnr family transcriptional regulator [Aestuariivirga sp.]
MAHILKGMEVQSALNRCRGCAVRNRAVCGAMNEDQIQALNSIARTRLVQAGQVIMSDQEPATFFANIISGTVKLIKNTPDGRQQIVGLLFAPDFLGRAFSRNNPYFAEAATDVEICMFPNAAFEKLVEANPDLQHRLFERTLDELDAAREWMLLLGRKTAEEKVASFLLLIARRQQMVGCDRECAGQGDGSFALPLTRADMADYLGLTIETVSRQVTRLKLAGVIAMNSNRVLNIPSMARLAAAAGQPTASN